MLTIKMKDWKYNKVNALEIHNIILAKLKDFGIVGNIKVENDTIVCTKNGEGKYFTSKNDNKIIMSPTDKRIATLGRDYLVTKRLTEDQYHGMVEAILGTLSNLQINAEVCFDGTYWRQGMINYCDRVFKPSKFAVKG